MPRHRSDKYLQAKLSLTEILKSRSFGPGSRFSSTRNLAEQYQISLPTAQNLVNELAREGLLVIRPSSGLYMPGSPTRFERVHLLFHPRGKSPDFKFERLLLSHLSELLSTKNIPWVLSWSDRPREVIKKDYHVIFEPRSDQIARYFANIRCGGLILDKTPSTKTIGQYFDSISMDFFQAGALAGQYLKKMRCNKTAILAKRFITRVWSEQIVHGFTSILPCARSIQSGDFISDAGKLAASDCDGAACVYQRQGVTILEHFQNLKSSVPHLVVVSKPPYIADFPVPLIGVSFDEFVENAGRIIQNRMLGDSSPPVHQSIPVKVRMPRK